MSYESIAGETPNVYRPVDEFIQNNFENPCFCELTDAAKEKDEKPKEIIVVANRGGIAWEIIREARAMGKQVIMMQDSEDMPWQDVLDRYDENFENPDKIFTFQNCFSKKRSDDQLSTAMIALLELRKKMAADGIDLRTVAIHPGYGFWSEDAAHIAFARRLGFSFVGPDEDCVFHLDKIEAKRFAGDAGFAIPKSSPEITSVDEAMKFFDENSANIEIFLFKAAEDGGGRGQKKVSNKNRNLFKEEVEAFKKDHNKFSVDQFIENNLHIEFQFLSDKDGNLRFMGARNCTMQRDHQKYIEETADLDPKTIDKIVQQTSEMMQLIKARTWKNYEGAFTLETLYSLQDKEFYFLEVNRRMQVEHPVTTHEGNANLIRGMLQICDGKKLKPQEEIDGMKPKGPRCVMEARICAEDVITDPAYRKFANGHRNFCPSSGTITGWDVPKGEDVFVYTDPRITRGAHISGLYDPMIAQVVVTADSRGEAIMKLEKAVREFKIEGVVTNQRMILQALENEDFRKGGEHVANAAVEMERNYVNERVAQVVGL
ncbi:MAG: biotin carboxylase N-terminal domain-containing protein [Candidatus Gracilibacteria bacterium]